MVFVCLVSEGGTAGIKKKSQKKIDETSELGLDDLLRIRNLLRQETEGDNDAGRNRAKKRRKKIKPKQKVNESSDLLGDIFQSMIPTMTEDTFGISSNKKPVSYVGQQRRPDENGGHGVIPQFVDLTDTADESLTELVVFTIGMNCPVSRCVSDKCYATKMEFDNHWRNVHWPMNRCYTCRLCHGTECAPKPSQSWELTNHFEVSHPLIKFSPLDTRSVEKILVCVPEPNPEYINPEDLVYKCDPVPPSMHPPANTRSEVIVLEDGPEEVKVANSEHNPSQTCQPKGSLIPSTPRYVCDGTIQTESSAIAQPLQSDTDLSNSLTVLPHEDEMVLLSTSLSMANGVAKADVRNDVNFTSLVRVCTNVEFAVDMTCPVATCKNIRYQKEEQFAAHWTIYHLSDKSGPCVMCARMKQIKKFELTDRYEVFAHYRMKHPEVQLDGIDIHSLLHCKQQHRLSRVEFSDPDTLLYSSPNTGDSMARKWLSALPRVPGKALVALKENPSTSQSERRMPDDKNAPIHPMEIGKDHGSSAAVPLDEDKEIFSKTSVSTVVDSSKGKEDHVDEEHSSDIANSFTKVEFAIGMKCPIGTCNNIRYQTETQFAAHWSNHHLSDKSGPCVMCAQVKQVKKFQLKDCHDIFAHYETKHSEAKLDGVEIHSLLHCKPQHKLSWIEFSDPGVLLYSSPNTGDNKAREWLASQSHGAEEVVVGDTSSKTNLASVTVVSDKSLGYSQMKMSDMKNTSAEAHPLKNVKSHSSKSKSSPTMLADFAKGTEDIRDNFQTPSTLKCYTEVRFAVGMTCPVVTCDDIKYQEEVQFAEHWSKFHLSDKSGPCVMCAQVNHWKKFELKDRHEIFAHYEIKHPEFKLDGVDVYCLLYCKERNQLSRVTFNDPGMLLYSSLNTDDNRARGWLSSLSLGNKKSTSRDVEGQISEMTPSGIAQSSKDSVTLGRSVVLGQEQTNVIDNVIQQCPKYEKSKQCKNSVDPSSVLSNTPHEFEAEPCVTFESQSDPCLQKCITKDLDFRNFAKEICFSPGMQCPVEGCSDKQWQSEELFAAHWTDHHLSTEIGPCILCLLDGLFVNLSTSSMKHSAHEFKDHYSKTHSGVSANKPMREVMLCKRSNREIFVRYTNPKPYFYTGNKRSRDNSYLLKRMKTFTKVQFKPDMMCPVVLCSTITQLTRKQFALHWTVQHLSDKSGPCVMCAEKQMLKRFELKHHQEILAHYALEHSEINVDEVDIHALLYCKPHHRLANPFRDPGAMIFSSPETGDHKARELLLKISADKLKIKCSHPCDQDTDKNKDTQTLAHADTMHENLVVNTSGEHTSRTIDPPTKSVQSLNQISTQSAARNMTQKLQMNHDEAKPMVADNICKPSKEQEDSLIADTKISLKLVCPAKKCIKNVGFETIDQFKDHWFHCHMNYAVGPCMLCMKNSVIVPVESRWSQFKKHMNEYHHDCTFDDMPHKWLYILEKAHDEKEKVTDPMLNYEARKHAEQVHFKSGMTCPVTGCTEKEWFREKSFAAHWTDKHISNTYGPCVLCLLDDKTEVFMLPKAGSPIPSEINTHFSLKHREIHLRIRSVYEVLLCKRFHSNAELHHIEPAPYFYSSKNTGNKDSSDHLNSMMNIKICTKVKFRHNMRCPVGLCSKMKYQEELVFATHWTTYHLNDKGGPCVLCAEKQRVKKFALKDQHEILAHYKLKHAEVKINGIELNALLYCKHQQGFNDAPYHDPQGLIYSSPNTGDHEARDLLKSVANGGSTTACKDNLTEEPIELDDSSNNLTESSISRDQKQVSISDGDQPPETLVKIASSADILDITGEASSSQQASKITGTQHQSKAHQVPVAHIKFTVGMTCPVRHCPIKGHFQEEWKFGEHWTDYHMKSNTGPCALCINEGKGALVLLHKNKYVSVKHYAVEHSWVDVRKYPREALMLCNSSSRVTDTFICPRPLHYSSQYTGDEAGRNFLKDVGLGGENLAEMEKWHEEVYAIKKEIPIDVYQPSALASTDQASAAACPVKLCEVSRMSSEGDLEAHMTFQHEENVQQYICLLCERSGNTRCNPVRKLPWSMWEHLRWAHNISPSAMVEAKRGVFPKCLVRVEMVHNVAYRSKAWNVLEPGALTQYRHSISAKDYTSYMSEMPLELEKKIRCPISECKYKLSNCYDENRKHWISSHASDCVHHICLICGFVEGKFMVPKLQTETFAAMREHFEELHPWTDPSTVTKGHINTIHVLTELVPNVSLIKTGEEVNTIHRSDPSCALPEKEPAGKNSMTSGTECPVPTCPSDKKYYTLSEYESHWQEVHEPWVVEGMTCVTCHENGIIYYTRHVWEMRRHLAVAHGLDVVMNFTIPSEKQATFVFAHNSRFIDPEPFSMASFNRNMKPHKCFVVDGAINFFSNMTCSVAFCNKKIVTQNFFESHWLTDHCPRVESCTCANCEGGTQLMSKGEVFSPVAIVDHYKQTHPMASWLYHNVIVLPPTSVCVKWQETPGQKYSSLRIKGLPCSELAFKAEDHITFPVKKHCTGEQHTASANNALQKPSAGSNLKDEMSKSSLSSSSHLTKPLGKLQVLDFASSHNDQLTPQTLNKDFASRETAEIPSVTESTSGKTAEIPSSKESTSNKAVEMSASEESTSNKTDELSNEESAALHTSSHEKSGEIPKEITVNISEGMIMKYEDESQDSSAGQKRISFQKSSVCPLGKCAFKRFGVNHWCQNHVLLRGYYCLLCEGQAAKIIHPAWLIRSHFRTAHPSLRAITERYEIPENMLQSVSIPGENYIDPSPFFMEGRREAILRNCLKGHYGSPDIEYALRSDCIDWLFAESAVLAPPKPAPAWGAFKEQCCPASKCQHLPFFHSTYKLNDHWEFRHSPVLNKYTCETCQMSMLGHAALMRHVRKFHHKENIKQVVPQLVLERIPTPFYIHPGDVYVKTSSDEFRSHHKPRYLQVKKPLKKTDEVLIVYESNMRCPVPGCSAKCRFPNVELFDHHWMSCHHPESAEYICWLCGSFWHGLNWEKHMAEEHPEINHEEMTRNGGLEMLVFVVASPRDINNGPYVYIPSCGLSLMNPVNVNINMSKASLNRVDPNCKTTFGKDVIPINFVENMQCPVPACLSTELLQTQELFDEHWLRDHTPLRDMYGCVYCGNDSNGLPGSAFSSKRCITLHQRHHHKDQILKYKQLKAPSLFFVDPWCFHYTPEMLSRETSPTPSGKGGTAQKRPASDKCLEAPSAKRRIGMMQPEVNTEEKTGECKQKKDQSETDDKSVLERLWAARHENGLDKLLPHLIALEKTPKGQSTAEVIQKLLEQAQEKVSEEPQPGPSGIGCKSGSCSNDEKKDIVREKPVGKGLDKDMDKSESSEKGCAGEVKGTGKKVVRKGGNQGVGLSRQHQEKHKEKDGKPSDGNEMDGGRGRGRGRGGRSHGQPPDKKFRKQWFFPGSSVFTLKPLIQGAP